MTRTRCFLLCLAVGSAFAQAARAAGEAPTVVRAALPVLARGDSDRIVVLSFAQAVPSATGTYSASQAERGKMVYEQSCSSCHGASLRGGANEFAAPALAGPFFYEKWSGRPLEEFFRYAAENMPPDQTRLSEDAYLDVMAYVLRVWQYPAGSSDLSADSPAMKRNIERPQR